MTRRSLPVAFTFYSLSLVPCAHAGDAATAEALFREGRALMEAGDYRAACPKLAESYAQDPGTGTLLALAVCQEQSGRSASAWASYAEAASMAKQDGRQDREQMARERIAALEPKLCRLTIVVDAATARVPGVLVKRDGAAVGEGAWGTSVPMDPGEHVVEVTAPGKRSWKATVTIRSEADSQTVQVPVLEDESPVVEGPSAKEAPPPVSEGTVPDRGVTNPGVTRAGPPLQTIGLVVGGAGLAAIALGGYFGLRAKSFNDDSNEGGHCNAQNECDPTGGARRDDATNAATVATIAFIAGGVLTAAGVTLFLVGGPKDKEPAARAEVTPAVGWNEAGMVVRGRF